MIANLGDLPYVVVIAVIVLVGGSQLPKIARNLGLAGKEFKKAQKEAEEESERDKQAQAAAEVREAVMAPKPLGPASTSTSAESTPEGEGQITLSPAQLDALLKAREEQVRREGSDS